MARHGVPWGTMRIAITSHKNAKQCTFSLLEDKIFEAQSTLCWKTIVVVDVPFLRTDVGISANKPNMSQTTSPGLLLIVPYTVPQTYFY